LPSSITLDGKKNERDVYFECHSEMHAQKISECLELRNAKMSLELRNAKMRS
jgi:hypothetical protein